MEHDAFDLTPADLKTHWGLETETIRRHARKGRLHGECATGTWKFRWRDVWRAEGRMPSRTCETAMAERTVPLLDKQAIARRLGGGVRSVERYLADDLPKLILPGGHVRVVPAELERWIARRDEARRQQRREAAMAKARREDPDASSDEPQTEG